MKINLHIPCQQELRELLSYDPNTGIFRWKKRMSQSVKAGDTAGTVNQPERHIRIKIFGRQMYAHQLAWLYVYGYMPRAEIDHFDGNPENNAISNLRQANRSHNMRNRKIIKGSKTGVTGVNKRSNGKYIARIMVNRISVTLGYFSNLSDAVEARRAAEIKYGFISRGTIR